MEKTKFEKKHSYPNLRENETLLWERFIVKYPEAYDEVAYNVKIGEGAKIPEGTQDNIADDFKQLTQLKIDVVGFKGDKVDIIELKPEPRASVLTQLKGYQKLFGKTVDAGVKTNLILITYSLTPDLETILEGEGIEVILV